ncbi:MAG: hypothetical protein HOF20_00680 [Pelagibacteraceae bacterium]|jgi:predicted restriction endonuclease|nr:hypothetical protein [Pelagibacteraceae bacterium]MBT4753603.1 hypothetical protein [Candidatus Neomarinimicrobiota bacterium]MBT7470133.1 hypothetical protein [Candidatus Cloacimonadota bacterium]
MIDKLLFDRLFEKFKLSVYEQSGIPLITFNSNPFTEEREGYKYDVHREARKILNFGKWTEYSIGDGTIVKNIIKAIELPNNNLVRWKPQYPKKEKPPHQILLLAIKNSKRLDELDNLFFNLYHNDDDNSSFENIINVFGKKYSLIAYFLFLKDRSRYMPIAPIHFENGFKRLGVDFKINQQCSFENYLTFNHLLSEVKNLLTEKLDNEVSLLDAHSFVWMIKDKEFDRLSSSVLIQRKKLTKKERETITKSRIGQGPFRKDLIKYWGSCSVTSCKNESLLTASHIKPWTDSDLKEAIDVFNGFLLSPSLNSAFDSGLITFNDLGKIIFSKQLSDSDANVIGINKKMKLKMLHQNHKNYLRYHRENIFKES